MRNPFTMGLFAFALFLGALTVLAFLADVSKLHPDKMGKAIVITLICAAAFYAVVKFGSILAVTQ